MSTYSPYNPIVERVNPNYNPKGKTPRDVKMEIITAFISTGEAEKQSMRRDEIAWHHNVDTYDREMMIYIETMMRRHDARKSGNPEN